MNVLCGPLCLIATTLDMMPTAFPLAGGCIGVARQENSAGGAAC